MKINLSLRWLLFTSFISLGILMIGAHTMVSREYFIRGLDAAIAKNMEEAGDTFAEVITPSDGAKGVMFSGFFIATEWEAMPDYVHQSFEQPPNEVNRLFKAHRVGNSEHHETMVFVMPYVIGKQTLFISNELEPPEAMSAVALGTMRNNTEFMIIISLALLGIVLVSAWALLKFVSRPISQLRQWTDSLDSDKIAEPVPDVAALSRALIQHAPERILWASNWPHVSQSIENAPNDAWLLDTVCDWMGDDQTIQQIFVDNPHRIYDFAN